MTSESTHLLVLEDDFILHNPRKFMRTIEFVIHEDHNIIQLGFLSFGVVAKFEQVFYLFNKYILQIISFLGVTKIRLRFMVKINNRSNRYKEAGKSFIPNDFLAGSHCYLVDKHAAALLLKTNYPVALPADGHLQAICRTGAVKSKRAIISQAGQRPGFSTIESRFTSRR